MRISINYTNTEGIFGKSSILLVLPYLGPGMPGKYFASLHPQGNAMVVLFLTHLPKVSVPPPSRGQ